MNSPVSPVIQFDQGSVSADDALALALFQHRKLFTTRDLEIFFQCSRNTLLSWQANEKYKFPRPLIHSEKGGKNYWSLNQLNKFIEQIEQDVEGEQDA
jgi:hypothetical protein